MSYIKNVNLTTTDLGKDAWGRPKTITDKSVFSSSFTYGIVDTHWVLPSEATGIDSFCDEENGALVLRSGSTNGDYALLRSRRHPAYQPNRGHLYSTAALILDPSLTGFTRRWGIYIEDATYQTGVLFELRDGVMYGVTLTTYNGVKSRKEVILDYSSYNIENGALFDIQFQWRGVGDYFFYINQELVGTVRNLGVADPDNKLTIVNPTLPCKYESINTGGTGNAEMRFGCVDITSEGGGEVKTRPGFVDTATNVAIATTATPVLIIHAPLDFKGVHNTRGIKLNALSVGSDAGSVVKGFLTRDPSIFGLAVLGDLDGATDFTFLGTTSTTVPAFSSVKFYRGATLLDLTDPTKFQTLRGGYIPKAGDNLIIDCPNEFILNHGDYFILMAQSLSSATTGYGTIALQEEV